MQEEPTANRVGDPGIRALFTQASRFQAWLDVEAALAQVQAELEIIPQHAAEEITRNVPGVVSVTYNIATKPPSTIEVV